MLILEYPRAFSDDVNGYIDIYQYDQYKSQLLEDFCTARYMIMQDVVNCDYQYRSCIVVAEMFSTPMERFIAMNDNGFSIGTYKVWDGIVYEIIDNIYTSVHWESNKSACRPTDYIIPDGCIGIDTGSFHENWFYILKPVPDNQIVSFLKGITK